MSDVLWTRGDTLILFLLHVKKQTQRLAALETTANMVTGYAIPKFLNLFNWGLRSLSPYLSPYLNFIAIYIRQGTIGKKPYGNINGMLWYNSFVRFQATHSVLREKAGSSKNLILYCRESI
jgi:hypothetical protein